MTPSARDASLDRIRMWQERTIRFRCSTPFDGRLVWCANQSQNANDFRFLSIRARIGVSPYSNFVPVICSYMAM
jgi:hypothetical protein